MQLDWMQIAIMAAGVLLLSGGSLNLAGLRGFGEKLLGMFAGGAATASGDQTLRRVEAWQQLQALCVGDCPKAVRLLDELFPHLRPGHVHPLASEAVR